jgi:pyruvate,water dikinase
VVKQVKKCWSSLFTPRAIFYRFEKKLNRTSVSVAVVVQKMVQSEISGICFTVHPVTKDYDQMVIEAGFGLGEAIVGGLITPDTYVVHKKDFSLLDINVSEQKFAIVKSPKGNVNKKLSAKEGSRQKLTGKQIVELAKICVKIEKHYKHPQDIEWALEKRKFYITQSRPITTL